MLLHISWTIVQWAQTYYEFVFSYTILYIYFDFILQKISSFEKRLKEFDLIKTLTLFRISVSNGCVA